MADEKKFNFYGGKSTALPRFVYRRLAAALQGNGRARGPVIDAAINEILTGKDPDLRKFKFFAPAFLKQKLSPDELAHLEQQTAKRRERASQLKMVFPHVGDEFSVDRDFLESVFEMHEGPALRHGDGFFTIGSCFARNVAQHLAVNGHRAKTFGLAEDLNSPMSNAFLLQMMERTADEQRGILKHWIETIFPDLADAEKDALIAQKHREIAELQSNLEEADCVILTLGNVVDFFRDDGSHGKPLMENIFPKFIAMPGSEDINVRSASAANLKGKGAVLRLATYSETLEAIRTCIRGIRSVTNATLVVTISPVPIDSVIGLVTQHLKSAIEVDCVSKSRIRSAFDEVYSAERRTDPAIFYFPSFEIVRWIAPLMPIPAFGLDDAASRHVSSPILNGICSLFAQTFVTFSDNPDTKPAEAGGHSLALERNA
jgi:hypothetical protein